MERTAIQPLFVLGNEYKDPNRTTDTVNDVFIGALGGNQERFFTPWLQNDKDEWMGAADLVVARYGVRFLKWKRTYTAVSVAFDLATEGEYVIEFFYRLCTLMDRDRGKDDTATPSTEEEITLVKEFLKSWIHSTDKPRAFVTIRVHGPTGDREVIDGPYIATSRSVTSRATLGLPVYDIEMGTVMFLQDSWRNAGVCNIPTLVCGGVVRDQETTSHTCIEKDWNRGAHPTMICIRHEDAFTICGYLHRDVNDGNILIVYDEKTPEDNRDGDRRGLLNVWAIAIKIAGLAQARQAERTIQRRNTNLKIVYAMLFCGLCYLRHHELGPDLPNIISSIFDVGINIGDEMRRGNGKLALGLGALATILGMTCDPFTVGSSPSHCGSLASQYRVEVDDEVLTVKYPSSPEPLLPTSPSIGAYHIGTPRVDGK
ncbi:hypothetical protein EDD18DRAFT_1101871 [Armillaria luteobubalina]|uniref:Fungal-type protein kinase domain-containing protein n=1 Tax=Armillaria luteobubalina TaxID=153913 RepID=A0AA39US09_9AGAR|nr:hypothetical protein EDD18DRAFT_1101871 [Armillaria luteobubalina]